MDLIVHNQPTKVLSTDNFYPSQLICQCFLPTQFLAAIHQSFLPPKFCAIYSIAIKDLKPHSLVGGHGIVEPITALPLVESQKVVDNVFKSLRQSDGLECIISLHSAGLPVNS